MDFWLIHKRLTKDSVKKWIDEETWQTIEGQPKILESAIEMIVEFKENLQRTLKGVPEFSDGQHSYEVFRIFKKYLMEYFNVVSNLLFRYKNSGLNNFIVLIKS